MFGVPAQAQKVNLNKLNLRDKVRQGLQILTGVLVGIVKTKKEIDCLCCQQVDALNGTFHNEQVKYVIMFEEFKTLCLNKVVLKNVLTGLLETGDPNEDSFFNRSPWYAAYKQFIWWVFRKLGK